MATPDDEPLPSITQEELKAKLAELQAEADKAVAEGRNDDAAILEEEIGDYASMLLP